jgi:Peptidyl-tRNA hydrolase PTH2
VCGFESRLAHNRPVVQPEGDDGFKPRTVRVRISPGRRSILTAPLRRLEYWVCRPPISARPVEGPLTHFVIVRSDLPVGAAAAQIVHAAGESLKTPVPPGTFAVVLTAANEDELRRLGDRLRQDGIEHAQIVEDDAPWSGQLMAIGVPPAQRFALRRYFSNFPLYGRVAQSRAPADIKPEVVGSRPASPAICPGSSRESGRKVDAGLNPASGSNSCPHSSKAERRA